MTTKQTHREFWKELNALKRECQAVNKDALNTSQKEWLHFFLGSAVAETVTIKHARQRLVDFGVLPS